MMTTINPRDGSLEEPILTPSAERSERLTKWGGNAASANSAPLAELLLEIHTCLKRYIFFTNESQPTVLALWVAHTWTIDAFDFTPYIHIFSPVKRCGKSTVLDVLELLVAHPWLVGAVTSAALFRKVDSEPCTLLFDEVDACFSNKSDRSEELRGILNIGFKRNGCASRCDGNNHDVRTFKVFCPKVLAGIGNLPDTVADRSIPIRLERKTRTAVVERFRSRDAGAAAAPIKQALEHWAKSSSTIERLQNSRPKLLNEIGDRQMDVCEPLLAIAEEAGRDWPMLARKALIEIYGAESEEDGVGVRLLEDIKRIFEDTNLPKIRTETLIERLIEIEGAPWAELWEQDWKSGNKRGIASKLARLLKPFKITSKTLRVEGEATAKGYDKSSFEKAWESYLSQPPSTEPDPF